MSNLFRRASDAFRHHHEPDAAKNPEQKQTGQEPLDSAKVNSESPQLESPANEAPAMEGAGHANPSKQRHFWEFGHHRDQNAQKKGPSSQEERDQAGWQ
ncbi:hypothetical protein N7462_004562 [Penicillium macrosclerotiorum]|uniref:uncharacterized protein n=1 Tax=Penicillium macrosclerotiorum TaxID=303699 RepID=UPI0025472993|nr:uncharacterized protein N7462_004562 [Penicillium macrosclerotiorum]KAJ5690170.1 hypothetical protein N7462_004562 [Penicillium macrosclerotiorum]